MKRFHVYILASKKNGTLYVGVTSDLTRRIYEHKHGRVAGFTKKYSVNRLVYSEQLNNSLESIAREKQLKNWKRSWKIQLIEGSNPEWKDLYEGLLG